MPNPLAGAGAEGLAEEVQFTALQCDNPYVQVEQLTSGSDAGTGSGLEAEIPFRITYTPLDMPSSEPASNPGDTSTLSTSTPSAVGATEAVSESDLMLVSPQLGSFKYRLKLLAALPAGEKPLRIQASLGGVARAVHTAAVRGSAGADSGNSGALRLHASLEGPDAGAFQLEDGEGTLEVPLEFAAFSGSASSGAASSTAGKGDAKAKGAGKGKTGSQGDSGLGSDGLARILALGDAEARVPLRFCPSKLGTAHAVLVLKVVGGTVPRREVRVPLQGTGEPPRPVGPLFVHPGSSVGVPFRSPFSASASFRLEVDSPLFSVDESEVTLGPQEVSSLEVHCTAAAEEARAQGRGEASSKLLIRALGEEGRDLPPWVFYLQAGEAPPGADAGLEGSGDASAGGGSGGKKGKAKKGKGK